ncbi:MAG: nitroreductase family protein [Clostridiales bacterium]|nr:nitroreductase family protein [Clostridiales bacterium]
MNAVIEAIVSRRSIRKFSQEKVSNETVELLLTAAMNAPSACNQQAWYFIVVTDRAKLEKLSTRHDGVNFVKGAPAAIIICGEPDAAVLDYYWVDDCSAATQNLLLAAHSLGLGATWTGINRQDPEAIEFFRQILTIPRQYIPFSMIPIGYPAEQRSFSNRYDEKKMNWD